MAASSQGCGSAVHLEASNVSAHSGERPPLSSCLRLRLFAAEQLLLGHTSLAQPGECSAV